MTSNISRRGFVGLSLGNAAWLLCPGDAGAEVSWLAAAQGLPATITASKDVLPPLLVTACGETIRSCEQWQERRGELRRWWLDFLQPLPGERRAASSLEVIDEEVLGSVVRQRLRYEVEPGQKTEAYLLQPAGKHHGLPGIVVFHSTVPYSIHQPAGMEGPPEKMFGLKLARQGYVTLCPRNFLWSDNQRMAAKQQTAAFQKRHPGRKGMAKMLWDAMCAVDVLAARPEVDTSRLGAIGHSLGAKEVLYLAAFDERIAVAVSSEGGIGTRLSNWDADWYLGDAIRAAAREHEHHEVLALVAPRAFLLIGGNSADGDASRSFVEAALEVYRLYDEPARLELFNHGQGHSVPVEAEQRIQQWFREHLPLGAASEECG